MGKFVGMLALFAMWMSTSWSAQSFTQSYKLSVTIPAIVGVNTPSDTKKQSVLPTNQTITETIAVRDQQTVVIRSIVLP